MFFFSFKNQNIYQSFRKNLRGFTIIEMLVVIAIVGIFSALILGSGFSDSNNRAKDDSAINEVLLSLKEVQSWGTGSREFAESYDSGFGVYLEKDAGRYVLFGEDTRDNKYGGDVGDDDKKELVEKKELRSSFIVDKICVNEGEVCDFNEVNFVYRRPNLGPIITVDGSGTIESAEIYFKNGRGVEKKLVVSSLGKLYIE